MTEASEWFACFGSTCSIHVMGAGPAGSAEQAAAAARRTLLSWHARFSRFDPGSELCRLNADPRAEVPVSAAMAAFADAAVRAAEATGGLVDPTLVGEIEAAGYRSHLDGGLPLGEALSLAPARRPARPAPDARWRRVRVDRRARTVTRPPGVMLDSGGVVKGLLADLLARDLAGHASFAIDCAGDLRVGGACRRPRAVNVASPFDGSTLHVFESASAGVATSGIGRRAWLDADGRPAHHLLDPATGRPAYTGVVQATALAPSALEAERRAKAAILSGPAAARRWLPHGGVLVHEDGSHEVVPGRPAPVYTVGRAGSAAAPR